MSATSLTSEQREHAKAVAIDMQWAGVALMQRHLRIGYGAGREAISTLEAQGVLAKPRGGIWWVAECYRRPETTHRLRVLDALLGFLLACLDARADPANPANFSQQFALIAPESRFDELLNAAVEECLADPDAHVAESAMALFRWLQGHGCCTELPETDSEVLERMVSHALIDTAPVS